MEIKQLTDKEVPELLVQEYASYFVNDDKNPEKWPLDRIRKRLNNFLNTPDSVFLLAMQDDQILGFACGCLDYYADSIGCYFQEILVFVRFQNSGIGSQLIEEFCRDLKNKNVSFVYGESLEDERHRKFYEKNGFKLQPQLVCWKKDLDLQK